MKILLLGGTGAMGSNVAQLLREDGIVTHITSRKSRRNLKNINYIKGNAKDIEFLKNVLTEKWDVIIDFMVYKTDEFRSRVNLLLNSTNQYFFLSSGRVYAYSDERITENSPRLLEKSKDTNFLSTDEYSLSKARQENILKESGYKNWTIIRPYITYNDHRLQLGVLEKEEWLYRALKGRSIVFSEDLLNKQTTMTHGMDVAKGLKALIGQPGALTNIFHITSNECCDWSRILSIYNSFLEKELGFRPKVILLNQDKFLKTHPAKYQLKYDRLFDRRFNNEKIGNYINTGDFKSIENGLVTSLEGFFKKPIFKSIDWKLEARRDSFSNEFTPLREIEGLKNKCRYLFYRVWS